MLTAQELKTSPLFHDISYEEYRRMLTCFQAAQRSYVPEEQVYDFTSSRTDAVGIVERGQVSLIRIDEAGVATVLEDMGPGGVFGRHLAFAGFAADSLEVVARSACDILFIDMVCSTLTEISASPLSISLYSSTDRRQLSATSCSESSSTSRNPRKRVAIDLIGSHIIL